MEQGIRSPFVLVWIGLLATAIVSCGERRTAGEPVGGTLPASVVAARDDRQKLPRQSAGGARQILFGDLHVHTTFSGDAFEASLPILSGEGAHPPADACDFARYCADLDFWSINDHANFLDEHAWAETKRAIRQCNSRAGDPADPDMVAFLGWEWTQMGPTRETHYGHKNVILRDTSEEATPVRPIEEGIGAEIFNVPLGYFGAFASRVARPFQDPDHSSEYWDNLRFVMETLMSFECPSGVYGRDVPTDCKDVARTPDVLFDKLRRGGWDALVIPHGNAWGMYTPQGASWNKQLQGEMWAPDLQNLIEVYSGHGNSEEHRPWRAVDLKGERPVCPPPTGDYLPCCWRAGEIIRSRCDPDRPSLCEEEVAAARANYLAAGASGHLTVPGAVPEDWQDCGQCRDCFLPAFRMRPGSSVQAALAETARVGDRSRRFRFGFLASSDNHTARPGTGYKEYGRPYMTDLGGPRDAEWERRLWRPGEEPGPSLEPSEVDISEAQRVFETERATSFLYTGGLVAVHAEGRDRDSVFEALRSRAVYGTSGPRILLWFQLQNGPGGPLEMGAEARMSEAPRFRATAAGAFEQKPGCPEHALSGLPADRLERLCRGECYHPGDTRRAITRVEVVRIRPRRHPAERLEHLIDDPWLSLPCEDGLPECTVEFSDPDFVSGRRDALYYVRAIQEPTAAVRAGGLRCRMNEFGRCVEPRPCPGGYRTDPSDDCLEEIEERAWSSPIFVDWAVAR